MDAKLKVKFKKTYGLGTPWPEILDEFLEHLGELYGYEINDNYLLQHYLIRHRRLSLRLTR